MKLFKTNQVIILCKYYLYLIGFIYKFILPSWMICVVNKHNVNLYQDKFLYKNVSSWIKTVFIY